ncbi:MAG: hypothetical protein WBY53_02840 [Acidobacteriaceae bacterium]
MERERIPIKEKVKAMSKCSVFAAQFGRLETEIMNLEERRTLYPDPAVVEKMIQSLQQAASYALKEYEACMKG